MQCETVDQHVTEQSKPNNDNSHTQCQQFSLDADDTEESATDSTDEREYVDRSGNICLCDTTVETKEGNAPIKIAYGTVIPLPNGK